MFAAPAYVKEVSPRLLVMVLVELLRVKAPVFCPVFVIVAKTLPVHVVSVDPYTVSVVKLDSLVLLDLLITNVLVTYAKAFELLVSL